MSLYAYIVLSYNLDTYKIYVRNECDKSSALWIYIEYISYSVLMLLLVFF